MMIIKQSYSVILTFILYNKPGKDTNIKIKLDIELLNSQLEIYLVYINLLF